jgi:hypothetical protein
VARDPSGCVAPNAGIPTEAVAHLTAVDARQLRVIDIKPTGQPGPGYFAETVHYSVALAEQLNDIAKINRSVPRILLALCSGSQRDAPGTRDLPSHAPSGTVSK